MRIRILFLLGNNEGQDKLCGRYQSRSDKVKSPCRYCKVPFKELSSTRGSPHAKMMASQVLALREKKDTDRLKKLSHHLLSHGNAFDGADFGADGGGSVNQCTSTDIMHTVQSGTMPYGKEGLFALFRLDSSDILKHLRQTDKELESRRMNPSQLIPSNNPKQSKNLLPTDKQLCEAQVFFPSFCKITNNLACIWGRQLQHQSNRSLG